MSTQLDAKPQQGSAQAQESTQSTIEIRPKTRFVIIVVIYGLLIVFTSSFLRIPIIIPTHWVSVVFFIFITPIFLFSISSMVRPWLVIGICFPTLALSELLWCGVYGCGGELAVNTVVTFCSWGIACLIISVLRSHHGIIAMLIGGFWTFLGLLIPTTIYYALILDWSALYMVIYALLTMGFNLALIPIALVLNYALRNLLHVHYIDELLPLQS